RELEAESGEQILSTHGSVDLGPGTDERVAALSECGVEFDVVDGIDLASRYPLRIEGGTATLLQRDGGVLNAAAALRAFLRGVRVRERARVTSIDEGRVHLEGGTIEARAVVVTAGAWVSRLVEPLGIRLQPTPVGTETCLYTNMPDESFVLERHGRIVVGSPCSGHGFKFAPVVGEELARLAIEAAA